MPNQLGENLFNAGQRVQLLFAAEPDPQADCSVRSFRFIRRRPRRTGRTSFRTALYGSLDSTTKLNLTPFVVRARQRKRPARLHQLRFPARHHVVEPDAGGHGCGQCAVDGHREGAGRAVRGADLQRISSGSVKGNHHVFTSRIHSRRHGFGGIAGLAAVRIVAGAGAERVRIIGAGVRLSVRRQRFEQHDHSHGRHQFPGLHLDSRQPRADRGRADADGLQRAARPTRFTGSCRSWRACFRRRNWRWWRTSGRWCSR